MEPVYALAGGLGRIGIRLLGVDLAVSGLEALPRSGPVILAANHVSYLDFVFLQRAAVHRERRLRFLTRHDAWRPGPLAWAMDRMRHVPVDRQAPAAAFLRARSLLRDGEALGIFPEAGISYSYAVRALMRGTGALARATGAPVVPAVIWGSQRIYSVGDPEPGFDLTRGRRVDIVFGEPLQVDPADDLTAWTTQFGHRLTAMLEELQTRHEHRPHPGQWAPWYPAHLGGHAPHLARAAELDVVPASAVTPTWGPWRRPSP